MRINSTRVLPVNFGQYSVRKTFAWYWSNGIRNVKRILEMSARVRVVCSYRMQLHRGSSISVLTFIPASTFCAGTESNLCWSTSHPQHQTAQVVSLSEHVPHFIELADLLVVWRRVNCSSATPMTHHQFTGVGISCRQLEYYVTKLRSRIDCPAPWITKQRIGHSTPSLPHDGWLNESIQPHYQTQPWTTVGADKALFWIRRLIQIIGH